MDATLTKLWAEGLSASQIAAKIGITKGAVIGRTHRKCLAGRQSPIKGIVLKPRGRPQRDYTALDAQIRVLHGQGMSIRMTAKTVHSSQRTVLARLRGMGLATRASSYFPMPAPDRPAPIVGDPFDGFTFDDDPRAGRPELVMRWRAEPLHSATGCAAAM